MLVQVYVDDIIFGSTKKSMCTEFEECMHKRFQMSSMGELTFFLGLQVKQQPDGIFISQDKYVADILKKFDFLSIRTATTPIESNKPLVKDEDGVDVDVHVYRSMIGSLMYLTASRPDIMFAVCACARFQVTPKASHLNALVIMEEPTLTENQQQVDVNFLEEDRYLGNARSRLLCSLGSRESLERDMDGTEEFLLSNLFDFWLTKVSTDRLKVSADSQSLYRYKAVRDNTDCGISQKIIRSDLFFDDADGIDSLNNQAIFDNIQLMGNQLKDVLVPLDHFPVPTLTKKVLTFMVKKGKNFSGKVTPLFDLMLVQQIEDEGEASERSSDSQPIPSPPHPSEDQPQTQTAPSPRPSPSIVVPNPEGSGGNHRAQAKEIQALKAQGRKSVKSFKGEPSAHKDLAFDDLDDIVDDTLDYMETEDAQDEGRISVVLEEKENTDKEVSTEAPVSTVKPNEGEGIADQNRRESATQTALTPTSTPTPTIFGDDETILQVLITMSQNKQKEKEKGVEIKNGEDTERPRPTSTRSILTLRPSSQSEKKFKQLANDEEVARKARLNADKILAEKLQEEEREMYTIEERNQFLYDTIAAQRRFLLNKDLSYKK
ncbi:uncharacterized mitochondrial protein-like protein [Tanacetum coccineum]